MRMFKRPSKNGGVWHYDFTVAGRRCRASTGTIDRALAKEIAGAEEDRQRRAARLGPQAVLTFGEAVALYLDAKKSPRFLLPLMNRLEHVRVAEIAPEALRGLAVELYPLASPATMNRQAIAPAQAVINHAASLGLAQAIRVRRFAAPRPTRAHGDWPWIRAFARAAVEAREFRLAALAVVMFTTGARIGQACRMTWADIDLAGRTAMIPAAKRDRGPRLAALLPAATTALRRLALSLPRPPAAGGARGEERGTRDRDQEKAFGFATVSGAHQAWRKLVKRAMLAKGLAPLTPHEAGRHGYGTQTIVVAGLDPATAARGGGWASPKVMLDTYAHPRAEARAIADAFAERPKRKRNAK